MCSGSFDKQGVVKTVVAVALWQQLTPGITGASPAKVQHLQLSITVGINKAADLFAVFLR
jgi:hypothetical protein